MPPVIDGNTALRDTTPEDLPLLGVKPATASHAPAISPTKLSSTVLLCNRFLEGGLPIGAITEWGVPLGTGGREIVLSFLAKATRGSMTEAPWWCLWAYSKPHLQIYPPAWAARGVSLPYVRFVKTNSPMIELKPIFLDSFFKLIILDAPSNFSDDDCAFLVRQARKHKKAILLLRDYFLTPKRGNVWAKLRLNCYYDESSQGHRLRVIRGLSPRQISLPWVDEAGVSV